MKAWIIAVVLALSSITGTALADKNVLIPDLSKATLVLSETQIVADQKPPTQVEIKTYKLLDNNIVRTYSVKGVIFRYDVGVGGAPPFAYRLVDKDGKGDFLREDMVGEMLVKGERRRFFIDLGPSPGMEYWFSYEDEMAKRPGIVEQKQILMGFPIYIPQWVILRFNNP